MKNIGKVVFILLIILTSVQINNAASPTQPPVGRVVWVKGEFKAVTPDSHERALSRMSLLYLKDTLVTGSNSQAQIVFTDNTLMTFREESKFFIESYEYHPQSSHGSVGKYIMNLMKGGFRTITGLIAKRNPSDYRVNTPVATIGVRGTDYTVFLNQTGQLYVGSYTGSPCVGAGGGSLCLGDKTPYAYVPKADATPVPVTQPPAELQTKLDVVPATIAPSPPTSAPTSTTSGPEQPSVEGGAEATTINQTAPTVSSPTETNQNTVTVDTKETNSGGSENVSNFCIQ
ncbi:MAG: hypothetical protein EPO11_06360 [Gammaproteobacteria bacterium]|nr:MAG: hypothetical protein EPO11_06360 [Gammaproteobacteria bacterium]